MPIGRTAAALLLGGALIVGCEKKEEQPAVPPAPPPQPQAQTSDLQNKAAEAGTAAQNAGQAAAEAAKEAGAAAATNVSGAAAGATAAVTEQAQKLLDEVQTYIKDHKWEAADTALKKLEGMKSSLPADWAAKIDQARKALDTAKAAVGTTPAVPG